MKMLVNFFDLNTWFILYLCSKNEGQIKRLRQLPSSISGFVSVGRLGRNGRLEGNRICILPPLLGS